MALRPIISVKAISKAYHLGDVRVPALRNVSVDILEKDFLIITGRNGSGKSTLLRQIGLLDRPDQGSITLLGQEVTKLKEAPRSRLRLKHVGYIFQEYALIAELTALENVMLPALMLQSIKIARPKAKALLEKVGLSKKLKNLPRQLSGGEQQKVAIARALMNDPQVIFADEPTANLDTIAAHDVLELFVRLNREGHTIVMITHEPEEKQYANRTLTLSDGRII
jgi:putative ABC transport system ATP-binding protein